MAGSKRTSTQPKEWAKHLRSFGKKEFWSSVRNIFRSEEKELLLKSDNPNDWGVGSDIKWPRTTEEELVLLDAMNSGEPGFIDVPNIGYDEKTFNEVPLPYIVAKRIDNGVNEKPLPKIVTIEVKGLPNTGKIMLLQLIDKVLHEKFGITALCAELEDKENLCDLDNIPQHHIDAMKSGKILIEMNVKELKEKISFPSSLQCPCCD